MMVMIVYLVHLIPNLFLVAKVMICFSQTVELIF